MEAITRKDLQEWIDEEPMRREADPMFDSWWESCGKREQQQFGSMPASRRLDYLIHTGELSHCPRCGARYVETNTFEYPDMIGETYGATWECCGYTESANSAIEYDHTGRMVDIG